MAETPYLLDSNILVRWVKANHEQHRLVISSIDRILKADGDLCYTSQNVAEFWSVCTRPLDRNGYGFSPEEADRRAKFFEVQLRLLPDGAAVHEEWRRLIVAHKVSGVQVYDARIAAAMRVHGVRRILTLNDRDFSRYPEVEALHPNKI